MKKTKYGFSEANPVPTVKHSEGGWFGCIPASGVGRLTLIDSTLDHMRYLNTLKGNLKLSAQDLNLGDVFWFKQYNEPKHTAHNVKFLLLYNIKNQFHTPPHIFGTY